MTSTTMADAPSTNLHSPDQGAVRVGRALISVSDKAGLVEFAKSLAAAGAELVSTGGTARALEAAGLPVTPIEALTGFPEMMDGRVKTLHPKVHGGLLARRSDAAHMAAAADHGIATIDLVCVNLYPFESTIMREGVADEEVIENIDIGGPSMIRSAAKNFESVAVVTSPAQYAVVQAELSQHGGATTRALRERLAREAFARTAAYDAAIARWFGEKSGERMAASLTVTYTRVGDLRYGENPHQAASLYKDFASRECSVVGATPLSGKALSYNNILDASAALEAALDLATLDRSRLACVVVKHTNPCGAALGKDAREAFLSAYAGDPLAAFGGIVALAGRVDRACAEAMVEGERFIEVVVAESFDDGAVELLATRWKNVRLVPVGPSTHTEQAPLSIRSVPGGALVQERDRLESAQDELRVAAGAAPSADAERAARFAVIVAKHLKSNAVCICDRCQLIGAGAGQMDRVAACRIAVEKAGNRLRAPGAAPIAASDAFFPFTDGPTVLIDAGVTTIVHPGGSRRDQETIDLCAARGVTCLLTGVRHFRH